MQTRFEHYVTTSMMGCKDSPPRANGELYFDGSWESRAFGMAIALAKKGHYEWEAFRQQLIASIAEWESEHALDDPSWNYYQRWLLALERLAIESDLISPDELEALATQFAAQTND
ncbi:MAG TPA: nitrile hydratase accessory protein [Stenomitos sp.]